MNLINRNVPEDLDVHVVVDNVSTHKTPEIHRWLVRHPRFTLHFTPTYSSWLNLVERWFAELTEKWLRRGTHRSTKELEKAIQNWAETWNDDPPPFIWHKTAEEILESLASYCQRISDSRSSGAHRALNQRSAISRRHVRCDGATGPPTFTAGGEATDIPALALPPAPETVLRAT